MTKHQENTYIKKEKQEKPVFSKRNASPPKAAFELAFHCTPFNAKPPLVASRSAQKN
jgi:hypothetical protein